MDDFSAKNLPPQPEPNEEPIPFDDDDELKTEISHSPLDLGGSVEITPEPVKPTPVNSPTKTSPSSTDRITGVKTFFTKLHAGAIDFVNGQINEWLAKNPEIVIKHTNTVVGEVASKKTEPNLIITVWY